MNELTNEFSELYEQERRRLRSFYDSLGDYASPVFGEGDINSKIMLIGEAPGKNEAEQGRVFVGKAGKQLNEMLELASLKREQLFITNAVKFRPIRIAKSSISNRTPTVKEIDSSLYVLKREIELIQPKFVITLGKTALTAVMKLTQADLSFTALKEIQGVPHSICANGFDFILYPMYHPASVIYNPVLKEAMEMSLRRIPQILVQCEV